MSRNIKRLTYEDLVDFDKAINILEQAMGQKYPKLRKNFQKTIPGVFVYYPLDSKDPVGAAVTNITFPYAHLQLLGVHPEFQGRGIGRSLMDAVEQWARESRAKSIDLTDSIKTIAIRGWYERRGYVSEGRYSKVRALD
jgi:GNAT superfamily N-acetyltransferase